MITERSFTIQGKIVKVMPIEKTTKGEDFGKFYVQTVTRNKNGNTSTAHYEIKCLGSNVEYVYKKAVAGYMCKVSGTLSSMESEYKGKTYLNYSLLADRIVVEEAEEVPQAQRYIEETVQGTPSIDDETLPF